MKALLAMVSCASLGAQQASIEGLAVDAVTKAPLPGVHVGLITGNSAVMTASYGAISDREGRFSVATIRPGTYIMLAERRGYLYAQSRADSSIPTSSFIPGASHGGQDRDAPRAILSGKWGRVRRPGAGRDGADRRDLRKGGTYRDDELALMPTDDRGTFRVPTVRDVTICRPWPGAKQ